MQMEEIVDGSFVAEDIRLPDVYVNKVTVKGLNMRKELK